MTAREAVRQWFSNESPPQVATAFEIRKWINENYCVGQDLTRHQVQKVLLLLETEGLIERLPPGRGVWIRWGRKAQVTA